MRKCLHVVLKAGYSPMRFFATDFRKYFYLAELLALVDLSLVSGDNHVTMVQCSST